jgi:hypothetical protein
MLEFTQKNETDKTKKRMINFLILFHPHPTSPVKGEEFASLPWREGLREGE